MNGVPSLTLPSISEDDENMDNDDETSPLSPNKSPLHHPAITGPSQILPITQSPRRLCMRALDDAVGVRPRGRAAMFMLRDKVERQRSLQMGHGGKTESLDELNHEIRGEMELTRLVKRRNNVVFFVGKKG